MSKPKQLKCEECGRRFTSQSALNMHRNARHPGWNNAFAKSKAQKKGIPLWILVFIFGLVIGTIFGGQIMDFIKV